ncbi:MAG: hypothetical protein MJE68_18520, partial [Proteobacteria bacterium]|nr:hypothetical protein [Pseudomonadota bacterium]
LKDNLEPEMICELSGMKVAHKVAVKVVLTKAMDRIPLELLKDYASYLTWGKCYHGALDPDFFYPNQDWEPPVCMIPVVQAPVGSFDRATSANSMRPTTPPWSQVKGLAPTVYPAGIHDSILLLVP